MKKITLTVIALLIAIVTFAQHTSATFGLKGGINLAQLKINNSNVDWKTGFNVGALAHMHLNSRFALQPEVVYSNQGTELANDNRITVNYLNVPVLGQYMFNNGLRLQTGPQLGFKINNNTQNGHSSILNNIRSTDLSWTLGAGYLTRSGLGIDARYNYGLTDISKNNTDIKNRVWQLGLFYQFRK